MRWGILGASKFARLFMGPAIHAARGAELGALATGNPDKAERFRAFCPGLQVRGDYEALLADPEIDAVYIPLPNHMHVDWTLRAAAAGKHVLCEKPIALQAGEIDRLIEARETSGRLIAEAFMIVHHPQWHLARDLVQSGAIGRLVQVTGRFSFDNADEPGNIRNRPETGGGALRDIGVYVFGAARFVTGEEPDDLTARIHWENGIDALTTIEARFPGFGYSAYVTMRAHPAQDMVFHGTDGVVRLTAPFNANVFGEARVEHHRPDRRVETHHFPDADHYVLQVEAFEASASSGAPYACPLEFSRGTQRMIDRAYAAAGAPPPRS